MKYFKLASELAQYEDLAKEFRAPLIEDKNDLKTLVGRAARSAEKALTTRSSEDGRQFINVLRQLEQLTTQFKHESFTPEFYDLLSDFDLWQDWIPSVETKDDWSAFDWGYASYLRDDLFNLFTNDDLINDELEDSD